MVTIDPAQRFLRQQDILPAQALAELTVSIIGVGAIGRQVAMQLAAIGVGRLQLVDFDTVEAVNLPVQGFAEADLGRPKVEATADACQRLHGNVQIESLPQRFGRRMDIGQVLVCCVDSIATRRHIFEAVADRVGLYIDTRMSAEVCRVLAVEDAVTAEHYRGTLFTAEQAHRGACTSKSTLYTANIAAGLAVSQLARWLRRIPVEPDITLNILTAELTCGLPVRPAQSRTSLMMENART